MLDASILLFLLQNSAYMSNVCCNLWSIYLYSHISLAYHPTFSPVVA